MFRVPIAPCKAYFPNILDVTARAGNVNCLSSIAKNCISEPEAAFLSAEQFRLWLNVSLIFSLLPEHSGGAELSARARIGA
jgi:hypothetical protein